MFNAPLAKAYRYYLVGCRGLEAGHGRFGFSVLPCSDVGRLRSCSVWMERVGPRKALFVAATAVLVWAFCVGYWRSHAHVSVLLYLGNGVIGGVGWAWAIGPVSTLMKWFPDKPGTGDRLGDYGFWWWRDAGLAFIRESALMNFFLQLKLPVGVTRLCRFRIVLFGVDDVRRFWSV